MSCASSYAPRASALITLHRSYLIGFKNLIRSIENIGVSAVYGINYFGRGHLNTESYVNYIKYDTLGKDLLNSSLNYVPYLKDEYKNLTNFREYGSIKNRWVVYVEAYSLFWEKPENFLPECSISMPRHNKKRFGFKTKLVRVKC